jgi:serine/threonine protein kinase
VYCPSVTGFSQCLVFSEGVRVLNGKGSSTKHRPDCFGPFPVRGDLNASRFGPVYLGRDTSTDTPVVIRTFELSRESREFGDQFHLLDSFRKLCDKKFDHPSLARPLASGAEGDIPYVAYSDLPGTAMDAVMRQDGPRSVAEVLQRTRQLADAIDCAASAGVHHGMMAPCDVILEGERTGVTGFGLAQALIDVGIPAEAGSPYGSPQRLAGAPPTLADDIYSLAAITLELLIGTPKDPDQDASRALREAQGLPERRRIPRPAPHETRLFTMIAGVDAGKLRAAFAAAFSDEPSERPSTAAEFVASVQDAVSNRRVTDEPAPSVTAVPFVSDERKEPPSAPVAETTRPDAAATLEPPSGPERVATEGRGARRRRERARRRETVATNQPFVRESHNKRGPEATEAREDDVPERKPEKAVIRLPPIVDDALIADVTPPRARSIEDASDRTPVRLGSRVFLVAAVVVVSFSAGFGGGFVVGHFSRPSTESIAVSHHEPVAEPQPTRAAEEAPKAVASTTQTVATISKETVSNSKAIVATAPTVAAVSKGKVSRPEPIASPEVRQPAAPAVESGRLLVRSKPAGAGVTVDGHSRGVTPLALRELAFGAHTIAVSHPGHDSRQRRVTLSERRPERSLDFVLRPTSVPAPTTAATDSTGSLQVASRPSGAQVFVDDNLIGTTPLLLSNVAAGSRHLRVELSGYKVWTTSVRIEPSGRFRVSASLEP